MECSENEKQLQLRQELQAALAIEEHRRIEYSQFYSTTI